MQSNTKPPPAGYPEQFGLKETLRSDTESQRALQEIRRRVVDGLYESLGPGEGEEPESGRQVSPELMRAAVQAHRIACLEHETEGRRAYWCTPERRLPETLAHILAELRPGEYPRQSDFAWLQGWLYEFFREGNGAQSAEEWVTK